MERPLAEGETHPPDFCVAARSACPISGRTTERLEAVVRKAMEATQKRKSTWQPGNPVQEPRKEKPGCKNGLAGWLGTSAGRVCVAEGYLRQEERVESPPAVPSSSKGTSRRRMKWVPRCATDLRYRRQRAQGHSPAKMGNKNSRPRRVKRLPLTPPTVHRGESTGAPGDAPQTRNKEKQKGLNIAILFCLETPFVNLLFFGPSLAQTKIECAKLQFSM